MLRCIELQPSDFVNRNDEIVAVLEELLAQAKKGNVDNLVIVAHVGDQMMGKSVCSGETDALQMVGALEQQKFVLLRELTAEQHKHSTTTL